MLVTSHEPFFSSRICPCLNVFVQSLCPLAAVICQKYAHFVTSQLRLFVYELCTRFTPACRTPIHPLPVFEFFLSCLLYFFVLVYSVDTGCMISIVSISSSWWFLFWTLIIGYNGTDNSYLYVSFSCNMIPLNLNFNGRKLKIHHSNIISGDKAFMGRPGM